MIAWLYNKKYKARILVIMDIPRGPRGEFLVRLNKKPNRNHMSPHSCRYGVLSTGCIPGVSSQPTCEAPNFG